MTLGEICKCLGLDCGDAASRQVAGFVTDSRAAVPGNVFVCIRGEKVDGHDFAAQAAKNGAVAILASRHIGGIPAPVLVVQDTIKALGRLAGWWRSQTGAKVLCITGTAGKTTLKQTLAAILSQAGKTACSEGNHNNQIGMPLSILAARGDEKFWILEAGISHAGDMEELGAIAAPDLALILNVGEGHTEGLGGRGVAWHKTRLLQSLRAGGVALVSADYPELLEEASAPGVELELFSARPTAGVRFAALGGDAEKGKYKLRLNDGVCEFQTPFLGEYGAETAIAAAAAATVFGLDCSAIQKGFDNASLPEQRFTKMRAGDWLIFDDTYNANPLSMRRMLEAAADYAKNRGLVLVTVLGEMGELGADAPRCHRELGKILARLAPEAVFWKGAHAGEVCEGLAANQQSLNGFHCVKDTAEFGSAWKEHMAGAEDRGVIIFKGSRSNRMEDLLSGFIRLQGGKVQ